MKEVTCPGCGGSGRHLIYWFIPMWRCDVCYGTGKIKVQADPDPEPEEEEEFLDFSDTTQYQIYGDEGNDIYDFHDID